MLGDTHGEIDRYAEGHLTTVDVASTRAAIKTLLGQYRAAGAPVFHVVHKVPEGAPIFTPNTRLAEEFDELKPEGNEPTLNKEHPGSFTGTKLDELIKATGRKQIVLTGYMAHVCVSTTARQADERGYDVILAKEAIGDRDIPGVKAMDLVETVLLELADGFGTIVSVKDVQ